MQQDCKYEFTQDSLDVVRSCLKLKKTLELELNMKALYSISSFVLGERERDRETEHSVVK